MHDWYQGKVGKGKEGRRRISARAARQLRKNRVRIVISATSLLSKLAIAFFKRWAITSIKTFVLYPNAAPIASNKTDRYFEMLDLVFN